MPDQNLVEQLDAAIGDMRTDCEGKPVTLAALLIDMRDALVRIADATEYRAECDFGTGRGGYERTSAREARERQETRRLMLEERREAEAAKRKAATRKRTQRAV
jgi:hypothetical protein